MHLRRKFQFDHSGRGRVMVRLTAKVPPGRRHLPAGSQSAFDQVLSAGQDCSDDAGSFSELLQTGDARWIRL